MSNGTGTSSIAVVGLGPMGSALAAALLARGYSVTVWNRTESKAAALVEQGAKLAENVAEAAELSQAMIVCVADYAAIKSVIHHEAVARQLGGKCLIQLGVVTPEQARDNAAWAQSHGIDYLEGSILGIPDYVVAGTVNLVCSGPAECYHEQKSVLEAFGTAYHISPVIGAAYQVDKLFYPFGYGATLGFIQGTAMARAYGYSLEAYAKILADWTNSLPERLVKYGKLLDEENYSVYQGTLEVWRDAYRDVEESCRTLGVDGTLPGAHLAMMNKGIDAGFGDEEILAVFKTLLPAERQNIDNPV